MLVSSQLAPILGRYIGQMAHPRPHEFSPPFPFLSLRNSSVFSIAVVEDIQVGTALQISNLITEFPPQDLPQELAPHSSSVAPSVVVKGLWALQEGLGSQSQALVPP